MGLRRKLKNLKKKWKQKKEIKDKTSKFLNKKIINRDIASNLTDAKNWLKEINNNLKEIIINNLSTNDITLVKNESIPKLAWCTRLNELSIIINYGSDVVHHENGIFEGAWDDDFSLLNYDVAKHVFGSGVLIKKDTIIFTPPSHMYECIYCVYDKSNKEIILSNTLSYLLSLMEINDLYHMVESIRINNDNLTKSGVFNYNPELFSDARYTVYGFYYHNILIHKNGIELSLRENQTKFLSYSDYHDYLLQVIKKLNNNSNDKQRKIAYKSLSSISKGYDSPAVTSLLKKVVDFDTVTINVDVFGLNDSGMDIAKQLNLKCYECSHPLGNIIDNLGAIEYPEQSSEYLNEFIATVGLGDDLVFLAFDSYLDNKMIFSGALGDTVWAFNDTAIPSGIPVRIPFGKSLNEYRIRKGFIHVPLPVIGAVFPNYIYRINFLKEMNKFHVESDYNRPIPRRIVEDLGVSRGSFANAKTATNPNPINFKKLKEKAFKNQIEKYSFKSKNKAH